MTWQIKGFMGPIEYPKSTVMTHPACVTFAVSDGTKWVTKVPFSCSSKTYSPESEDRMSVGARGQSVTHGRGRRRQMTDVETPPEQVFQFDTLLNPEFSRAPQPWYRLLRNTNPVLRTQSLFGSERQTVYLSKHEDIDFALHHPEVFSNKYPAHEQLDQWLVPQQMDPPEHRKYRKILDPLFSVRNMNGLAADIEHRINELIDAFIGRGECDVVEEFAIPLPASVFMRLMGLPLEEANTWLDIKERMIRGDAQEARSDMSQTAPNLRSAHREFVERFEELIEERRREPQDDVLTAVVERGARRRTHSARRAARRVSAPVRRRARHGDRQLDLLLRVSRRASRPPTPAGRGSRHHPDGRRGDAALRDARTMGAARCGPGFRDQRIGDQRG